MTTHENLINAIETREARYMALEKITIDGFKKNKEWFYVKESNESAKKFEIVEKRQYKSRNALMQKMNKIRKDLKNE